MLVYGDHHEMCEPGDRIRDISRKLDSVATMAPGMGRHSTLVSVLTEAGQLLQGIADAEVERLGRDRQPPVVQRFSGFLLELGRAVCRSWDSGFREIGKLPHLGFDSALPAQVSLKVPEGFAFYAVYPEAYVEAARRLNLVATPRVIGIRSIGTSLAAVVAAALDAPPPVTVRPFGDPYDRKVAIDAELERELLAGEPHFIIVDEGPGQSGSSFGAVCDWLQERAVPLGRIALLPSHSGAPGAAASERHRRCWHKLQRQPADFGACWPNLLHKWCPDVLGWLEGPLHDISGGAWRPLRFARHEDWPAAVPAWERWKFVASTREGPVLLKFAGLGEHGERKLAIARALYSERLVPEPLGLVHGFFAERWLDDAVVLAPDERPIEELARYISTRARLLPAISGSGASMSELLTMVRRNVSLEFGEDSARNVDRWEPRVDALERRVVRVRTDNKLDRHEWLRSSGGSLIKTDALDHHQAHDLIGCQSVEWDAAGAIAEFDLDQREAGELVRSIESGGCPIDAGLLEFSRVAYLAFRLGQARLGAELSAPSEVPKLQARGDRYALELQLLLEPGSAADRLECSLD